MRKIFKICQPQSFCHINHYEIQTCQLSRGVREILEVHTQLLENLQNVLVNWEEVEFSFDLDNIAILNVTLLAPQILSF